MNWKNRALHLALWYFTECHGIDSLHTDFYIFITEPKNMLMSW